MNPASNFRAWPSFSKDTPEIAWSEFSFVSFNPVTTVTMLFPCPILPFAITVSAISSPPLHFTFPKTGPSRACAHYKYKINNQKNLPSHHIYIQRHQPQNPSPFSYVRPPCHRKRLSTSLPYFTLPSHTHPPPIILPAKSTNNTISPRPRPPLPYSASKTSPRLSPR